MKKVEIPVEAVREIRKLQYQIEEIMLDLEKAQKLCLEGEKQLELLKKENIGLRKDITDMMLNGMTKNIVEKYAQVH
tara:strand:- start:54 stop:284 length:231 start_codon:yes stop_codon:yes gene_type:complete